MTELVCHHIKCCSAGVGALALGQSTDGRSVCSRQTFRVCDLMFARACTQSRNPTKRQTLVAHTPNVLHCDARAQSTQIAQTSAERQAIPVRRKETARARFDYVPFTAARALFSRFYLLWSSPPNSLTYLDDARRVQTKNKNSTEWMRWVVKRCRKRPNVALPALAPHNTKSAPARTLFYVRTFALFEQASKLRWWQYRRRRWHKMYSACLLRAAPTERPIDRISSTIHRDSVVRDQQNIIILSRFIWAQCGGPRPNDYSMPPWLL